MFIKLLILPPASVFTQVQLITAYCFFINFILFLKSTTFAPHFRDDFFFFLDFFLLFFLLPDSADGERDRFLTLCFVWRFECFWLPPLAVDDADEEELESRDFFFSTAASAC